MFSRLPLDRDRASVCNVACALAFLALAFCDRALSCWRCRFGGAVEVTAAQIGVHPDKTRFVLELDEPSYRIFTLLDSPTAW